MSLKKNFSFHKQVTKATKPKLIILPKQAREVLKSMELTGFKIYSTPLQQKEIKPNISKPQVDHNKKLSQLFLPSTKEVEQATDKVQLLIQRSTRKTIEQTENIKPKNKMRRSKTFSNFFAKKSLSAFHIENCTPQNQPIIEIQQSLKKDQSIRPLNALVYSIKREKLHDLIIRIIKATINTGSNDQQMDDSFLKNIEAIKTSLKQSKAQSLKQFQIIPQTFNYIYNPSLQQENYWHKTKQFEQLVRKVSEKNEELNIKQQAIARAITNRAIIEIQLRSIHREIYQIKESLQQNRESMRLMEEKKQKMENQLQLIQDKYSKMFSYIAVQNNHQVIKMASKEYLEIQSEIYDYASYLQCNQLANDLSYEPRPFRQIQYLMEEDLKLLTSGIMRENGRTVEQKLNQVKAFIISAMNKFKNKDQEMLKLNEFKTKCALTFISKMKRYLSNWELKQEYLVNLKKEYAFLTIQIHEFIKNLNARPNISQEQKQQYKKLSELVEKLQINFSMGNSFY